MTVDPRTDFAGDRAPACRAGVSLSVPTDSDPIPFFCTRPEAHDGPHVAHDRNGQAILEWDDVDSIRLLPAMFGPHLSN